MTDWLDNYYDLPPIDHPDRGTAYRAVLEDLYKMREEYPDLKERTLAMMARPRLSNDKIKTRDEGETPTSKNERKQLWRA